MVKKIILGTLFVGLVGLLIFGAVNSTIAKSDGQVARGLNRENEVASDVYHDDVEIQPGDGNGRGGGRGQAYKNEAGVNSGCNEQGGSEQGKNNQEPGSGGGQGRGSQGRNSAREASGTDVYADALIQTIEGIVGKITPDAVTINTAEGKEVLIEGRAWRYAQVMGYSLREGQSITVSGFEEDGEFKAVEILDGSGVSSFQFREKSGRPFWAGRGQGNGRNQPGKDV